MSLIGKNLKELRRSHTQDECRERLKDLVCTKAGHFVSYYKCKICGKEFRG